MYVHLKPFAWFYTQSTIITLYFCIVLLWVIYGMSLKGKKCKSTYWNTQHAKTNRKKIHIKLNEVDPDGNESDTSFKSAKKKRFKVSSGKTLRYNQLTLNGINRFSIFFNGQKLCWYPIGTSFNLFVMFSVSVDMNLNFIRFGLWIFHVSF